MLKKLNNGNQKETIKIRAWETKLAVITEKEFDYDLHVFEVYNKEADTTRTIYPDTIEDMNVIIRDLDEGCCPIDNGWDYND